MCDEVNLLFKVRRPNRRTGPWSHGEFTSHLLPILPFLHVVTTLDVLLGDAATSTIRNPSVADVDGRQFRSTWSAGARIGSDIPAPSMQAEDPPDGFSSPCLSLFTHPLEQWRAQFASTGHRESSGGRDPIESLSNPNQRVIQHLLMPLFSALLSVTATTSGCQYEAHEPVCVWAFPACGSRR